jgi:hypothetical protein
MELLTTGNAAKLYCLNWIEAYIKQQGAALHILDLGSGTSFNFTNLLPALPASAICWHRTIQDEHMRRWLESELWLNEVGVSYHDSDAKTWVTRNFILRKG